MKLFFSPNSPYARIARVAIRECGLIGQVTEITAANRRPDNPVLEFSPVGRVPVLVSGNLVITESKLICAYIAETTGDTRLLDPSPRDWVEAAQEGQILGFLEGVVSWARENRREKSRRSTFLLQVEDARARRCLAALNSEAAEGLLPDVPRFRAIALASALSLMDLDDLLPGWRQNHSALYVWYEDQAMRQSMIDTVPTL